MRALVKFKQKYYKQIVEGVKTQTMRMPHKRLDVHEDDEVIGIFPDGSEVILKIKKVGYKAFKSINDEDAEREGFNSAEELQKELLDIYGDGNVYDFSRIYYYRFLFMKRVNSEIGVEMDERS